MSSDSDNVNLVLLRHQTSAENQTSCTKMLLTGTFKHDVEHQLSLLSTFVILGCKGTELTATFLVSTGHAHSHLTFRLSSVKLFSEILFVPTMINESKAGTEKLRKRKDENQPQSD